MFQGNHMAMFGPQPRARGTPARPRPQKAIAAGTLLAAGLMLASCAPGALSFQSQRIAYEPADDACRGRVLALDSTGNFFAARILAGAAIGAGGGALIGGVASQSWNGALIGAISGAVVGGAAGYWSGLEQQNLSNAALADRMSGDLSRENAEIDRTQYTFDRLTDCRFHQAAEVRAAYRAGRLDRDQAEGRMAELRQLAQGDLGLAQLINDRIQGRGAQFAYATQRLGAPPPPPVPSGNATVRRAVALKLTPSPDAPSVEQLRPRERVTVTGGRDGYALVRTPGGTRGYTAASDLAGPGVRSVHVATVRSSARGGSVGTLAGSNAARRDAFAQSVAVTQSAETSGFQLSS